IINKINWRKYQNIRNITYQKFSLSVFEDIMGANYTYNPLLRKIWVKDLLDNMIDNFLLIRGDYYEKPKWRLLRLEKITKNKEDYILNSYINIVKNIFSDSSSDYWFYETLSFIRFIQVLIDFPDCLVNEDIYQNFFVFNDHLDGFYSASFTYFINNVHYIFINHKSYQVSSSDSVIYTFVVGNKIDNSDIVYLSKLIEITGLDLDINQVRDKIMTYHKLGYCQMILEN
ncbi:hypothetical protein OHW91_09630, partial [Acinetobacter baumannii]|nr:hypothetical protein [Acinetobacter baumannii]